MSSRHIQLLSNCCPIVVQLLSRIRITVVQNVRCFGETPRHYHTAPGQHFPGGPSATSLRWTITLCPVWLHVLCHGRRCLCLAACTVVWPQVLSCDPNCFCLAAGALVWPSMLLLGRKCCCWAACAFLRPQLVVFALPQVLLFGRGVFRYLTQS